MDDEFGTPRMDEMYEAFEKAQKEKKRFDNIEVTRCRFIGELKDYMEDEDSEFSAVILDVVGPESEENLGDLTQYPFYQAAELLKDKDVILKVFSGDPDYAVTRGAIYFMKTQLKWEEGRDIFYKQDDYHQLFRQLSIDLEEKLGLFKSRPHLLDMFRTGRKYLPAVNKERITKLLAAYVEGDTCFTDKQYLRDLLQDVLESFVYTDGSRKRPYQFIKDETVMFNNKKDNKHVYVPKGSMGRLGALASRFYNIDKNQTAKFDKMRALPGDVIQLLVNACNKFDHCNDYYPAELPDYMSMKEYMNTIYTGFLSVLSWYYNMREADNRQ